MTVSCAFLQNELRQCSKEEGVMMADSVEMLGVDLRISAKSLGVKQKVRRKKCKVRFVFTQEKVFLKSYLRVMFRSCYERVWCLQERAEFMQWEWRSPRD